MKRAIRIGILIVMIPLTIFGVMEMKAYLDQKENLAYNHSLFSNKTVLESGFKSFANSQRKVNPKFDHKKYYYINIWETRCIPCIKEMPGLDSLAGLLPSDVECFFVTEQTNEIVTNFLDRKKFHLKNFTIVNDQRDFCAGIFNEIMPGKRIYPVHVILDNTGKIVHFHAGAGHPVGFILIHQFKKLGLLK